MAKQLDIGSTAFFEAVGEVARSAGEETFYERLVELPAHVVGCDRWRVVRYAHYAVPEIIVNHSMTDEAVRFYYDGLYRLDPLMRLVRSDSASRVVSLSRLRDGDGDNAYFDEIFRTALIFDELALLLTAPGRICVALCLDRSRRPFSDQEVHRIETVFPALDGLHHAHLNRVFTPAFGGAPGNFGDGSQPAVMILDRENRQVCCNRAWREAEARFPTSPADQVHKNRDAGSVSLDQSLVLHWERLSGSFAVAPHGKICIIEQRGPGNIVKGFESTLNQFAERQGLTARECDIVKLVLRGYPNALIAKELDISPGTVRNHRSRLYFKLDITTERELFSLFLRDISSSPSVDPVGPGALLS